MKCAEPWKKIVVLLKDSWKTFRRTYFSEVTSQAAQAPAVRWSPCEIRVSEIIRVCMGIFTAALRNKKLSQILNTNISPYFQSALLAIWPLTMLKRTHFSELSISRFTHKRSTRLHTPLPNARLEKRNSNLKITRRPKAVSFHFEIFHYLPSFFLLRPLLIMDEFEHELSKPKQKVEANNTDTRFDNSQQNAKTEFTNYFIINFLNNLKKKTLLFEFADIRELDRTWLMQYGLSC